MRVSKEKTKTREEQIQESREKYMGMEFVNTRGNTYRIVEYRRYGDIDVLDVENNYIVKHEQMGHIKRGNVQSPYEKTVCGIGFLGEGEYKASHNRKLTRVYKTWWHALDRCYNPKYHEKFPTYIGCEFCEEWHNFQNFAKWYDENYYEIKEERMCLDKDVLKNDSKIYSPSTCIFIPNSINAIFKDYNIPNKDLPTGVIINKKSKKYNVRIYSNESKIKYKYFDSLKDALDEYLEQKRNHIITIANKYRDDLPEKVYDILMNYKVEKENK